MGSGIAEVCARHGLTTHVCEVDGTALDAGRLRRVEKSLERGLQTGKLTTGDIQHISGRISYSTDLDSLAPCDVVIEAIVERLPEKVELFGKLDTIVKDGAMLASNTSSLPIIEVARATKASRPRGGHALLQPGAGDEATGGGAQHRHQRANVG